MIVRCAALTSPSRLYPMVAPLFALDAMFRIAPPLPFLRSLALLMCIGALPAHAASMTLFDGNRVAAIIHEDQPTLALAARLLARDLEALSGRKPLISTRLSDCGASCVVLGRYDSAL